MTGLDWALDWLTVTDGDTIRGHIGRTVVISNDYEQIIRSRHPRGVPLRLVTLDTPERGEVGFAEARLAIMNWLSAHPGELRVETYESAGWDRLLADVYVETDRGNTLSQFMLQSGWDPYIPDEARAVPRG